MTQCGFLGSQHLLFSYLDMTLQSLQNLRAFSSSLQSLPSWDLGLFGVTAWKHIQCPEWNWSSQECEFGLVQEPGIWECSRPLSSTYRFPAHPQYRCLSWAHASHDTRAHQHEEEGSLVQWNIFPYFFENPFGSILHLNFIAFHATFYNSRLNFLLSLHSQTIFSWTK